MASIPPPGLEHAPSLPPLASVSLTRPQGVISVTSNLVPGLMHGLMEKKDDSAAAALSDLMGWLFCEPNPIPL